MNAIKAMEYLNSLPNEVLANVYDDDEMLAGALQILIPDFEYPNFSYKTISQIRKWIASRAPQATEPAPPVSTAPLFTEVIMTEILAARPDGYSPEWEWIAQNASMRYLYNNVHGLRRYILDLSSLKSEPPSVLASIISVLKGQNVRFVLFK